MMMHCSLALAPPAVDRMTITICRAQEMADLVLGQNLGSEAAAGARAFQHHVHNRCSSLAQRISCKRRARLTDSLYRTFNARLWRFVTAAGVASRLRVKGLRSQSPTDCGKCMGVQVGVVVGRAAHVGYLRMLCKSIPCTESSLAPLHRMILMCLAPAPGQGMCT